jgi:hypothetical protein
MIIGQSNCYRILIQRGKDAEHWGRSIRTEWDEGSNRVELYDQDQDPHEYTNLAEAREHAKFFKNSASRSPRGYRAQKRV